MARVQQLHANLAAAEGASRSAFSEDGSGGGGGGDDGDDDGDDGDDDDDDDDDDLSNLERGNTLKTWRRHLAACEWLSLWWGDVGGAHTRTVGRN